MQAGKSCKNCNTQDLIEHLDDTVSCLNLFITVSKTVRKSYNHVMK